MFKHIFNSTDQPVGIMIFYVLSFLILLDLFVYFLNTFVTSSSFLLVLTGLINVACLMFITKRVYTCKCAETSFNRSNSHSTNNGMY